MKKKKQNNDPKSMRRSKRSFRGKFIAIQVYVRKQEKSQINNLTLHLNKLEREEQAKPNLVEGKKS